MALQPENLSTPNRRITNAVSYGMAVLCRESNGTYVEDGA